MNDYSAIYESSASSTVLGAALGTMLGFIIVFSLIVCVLSIIAMWRIFTKAGKPGWASIIPVYNMVVLFQIVGMNPWLLLLYIVPFVNYVASIVLIIMLGIKLAKAFGKSSGFAVGLIFLNTIFMLILGLGNAEYVGIPESSK